MAELVVGETHRFTVPPTGALVGRRSSDGTFRPDIDLAGVEGGQTVSRHHARIFLRDGTWYLEVEPTVTNVTVVGGRPVGAGQEAPIKDGDQILLGKVTLVFQAGPEPVEPPLEPPVGMLQPTAALNYEGQLFPLAAMEGQELTLGRHSDDRAYQPDVDLGDLPYGRTISRRHGRLYHRNEQWFLRVEAEVTNPTLLNGQQLAKGQEVALQDGNQLQLGRVIVTFQKLEPIPVVSEEQIELILEPAQVAVEAGRQTQTTVTVINHTGHVDWFRVEVEGLPESWYRILLPDGTVAKPAQVRLFHTAAHATPAPDAVAQLTVVFAPPREYQSRAGVHAFAISATTQGEPQARRVTAGQLTIQPFESLELKVEPEEIMRPRGEFKVDLHNAGNDQIVVALQAEGSGLVFQWDQPQVQLNNGAYAQLKVQAKAEKRHWLGMDRKYAFSVVARSGEQELSERAWLSCPPRIPIWIQTAYQRVQWLLAPLMMLLVLVGIAYAFARPPEIKDFKAEPASVIVGTPVSLSWSLDRAAGVSIEPSSGNEELNVPEGNLSVAPAATTKYTLTARNMFGIPSSRSVNVEVKPAPQLPKILSFTASPERIKKDGEAVTLRWQTDGATKVTIEPADEVKAEIKPSGEIVVHPSKNNATYKLVATNDAGTTDAVKTITIEPPQIVSFSASPESVVQGGEVRLRWSAQGFTKLVIKASKGEIVQGKQELEVPADATDQIVRPLEDTEYTLTATNSGGSDSKTVKVTASPMKIVFFKAEPASIPKGESTTLSWSVQGATSISVEPGIGAVAPGETSRAVKPEQTTEYTLTATGPDNKQVQQKVNVEVTLGAVKIDFFTAAPPAITKGEQATLTFSVQNAKTIVIQGPDGSRTVAAQQPVTTGSITVRPNETATYIIRASNDSGQATAPATVEVRAPTPAPPPPQPQPEPKPGG